MESWNASLGEEKMKRKDVILKPIPERRYGGIDNATLVDVPELWSPRCSPFRIHQRVNGTFPHMTCVSPADTLRSTEKIVSERVKLKASAGSRRSFLTGNSCHLLVSADWSSVLLRSLLPYVVSMQRQTEMSAAEKKAAKKEGFALWDLWVQPEGKVRQGKAKHVPWMHGRVNCCCGLWSHGKTGCREQERPDPNQGGK